MVEKEKNAGIFDKFKAGLRTHNRLLADTKPKKNRENQMLPFKPSFCSPDLLSKEKYLLGAG